uniref:Carboxylic ester hydrolase n=1 Tax=Oncorhynchus kisutch TaxID=8019 RepID=A0A8C7LB01_ONCKI
MCVCTLSGGGAWCTEGYLFECQLTVSLSKDTAMMRTTLLSMYLTMVFLGASLCTTAETGPVVSLKNGKVRGEYMTVKGIEQRVQQYLGIPFARPPVGPLRLAAPQPAEPWEGERDGTRQPHMCIQDPVISQHIVNVMAIEYDLPDVSEDCLYLNVYTPKEAATVKKLPVFFWIHGGGLSMGAASQYDASPLAAYQNMVVVIIQYRLGILGFLSTGDEHAPGNWGFLDQIAALKWVQENIESFGGDPQSVTIAGESAGGISASILTLSPLAKGLFHRAIFQSGVATLGTYTSKEPLVIAKMKTFMGATVDGVFLKDLAEELLKSKAVEKVPVLLGVTNHEFGWILPSSFAPPGWSEGIDRQSAMSIMNVFYPTGASGLNNLIADEYFKDAKTPEDIRDGFTEMLGDLFMVLPVIKVAGYHRDAGAPVYMYEFQHRPEMHKETRPSFVKSDHADDIGFMFGSCFWNGHIKITGTVTEEEEKLCKTMMAYWANFARTGSPNGEELIQWPLYDQKEEYMELGLKQVVAQSLKKDKVHFMTVLLPQKLHSMAAAASQGN